LSPAKYLLGADIDINVKNPGVEEAFKIVYQRINNYNEIANLIRAKMEKQQLNEDSTTSSQSICENAKEGESKDSQGKFTSKTRGADKFSPANIGKGKVQCFLNKYYSRKNYLEPKDTVRIWV